MAIVSQDNNMNEDYSLKPVKEILSYTDLYLTPNFDSRLMKMS